jgi:hypothetical protein
MPVGHQGYNQTYGVQNYGAHPYHSYMDAFTVSNLLSSACDNKDLCQSLMDFNFPGFNVQGPA